MASRKATMMRTRPWLLILGREEEEVLQRERHLQSRGGRRTLARSSVLLVMSMVIMLHSVHNGRKGEGSNRHQQQEVDEVADRLQREFLLVFALSGTVSGSGTWLVDSGASCHMTGAWELFESFTETDSDLCVELGMGTKHVSAGIWNNVIQMESGDVLRVTNVLWVPELKEECALSLND
jgi:hypothetical protein